MTKIRVAIVGVGNCASSLVQGIHYYADRDPAKVGGVMHWWIGGYLPSDIEVSAAFDVDRRKVGKDVAEAIFAEPNCTTVFCSDVHELGVPVEMGRILDGLCGHMENYPDNRRFIRAEAPEPPPLVAEGAVPYVVTWPRDARAAPQTVRSVPDVRGLSVREAARRLHDRGFRVRLEGWGRVSDMEPGPGSNAARGTMITLRSGRVKATP